MGAVMLGEYLAKARAKPFRYGRTDCALFTARWVKIKTGKDLRMGIKYQSLREGVEALRAAGYDSHIDVAAAHLPEIPPLQAQRGDIGVVNGCLGIVLGERIALLERRGFITVPITSIERAFRV
jgi:hypothetical protein